MEGALRTYKDTPSPTFGKLVTNGSLTTDQIQTQTIKPFQDIQMECARAHVQHADVPYQMCFAILARS